MEHEYTPSFQKDLQRLSKKFRSLPEDLQIAQKSAVELKHVHALDNRAVFAIPGYSHSDIEIYKLRKFACKSLKGSGAKSGIRVIYAYHAALCKAVYLEIYFKGHKASEDPQRIKGYLAKE